MNWVDETQAMSPERNNDHRSYRLDSFGLQLGLGVGAVQLLGVPAMGAGALEGWRNNGHQRSRHVYKSYTTTQSKDVELKKTIDGIPIRKVYVTKISIELQRAELYDIFGRYGSIMQIYLSESKNDSSKFGRQQFAFITFFDPKDATLVLLQKIFIDRRGNHMYAVAADSWHQPLEGPDGEIILNPNRRTTKVEEESEEDDDQTAGADVEEDVTPDESINILNDDCFLHIFSFLNHKEIAGIERVCKRWQGLSYRMWSSLRKLKLSNPPFKMLEMTTHSLEQYLKRCGQGLTLLDMDVPNHNFNVMAIIVLGKYCPNLEVLKIYNLHLAPRSLAYLGHRCPKLKEFVMEGCAKSFDGDLKSMLPKCPQLRRLELSHNNIIIGKFLTNVNSPIQNLKFTNCSSIKPVLLLPGLKKVSKTLESLTLTGCGNLHGRDLDDMLSAVPNLTSLSMSYISPPIDSNLLSSISRLKCLKELNLNFNIGVTDSVLTAIVTSCENLTHVTLSGSGGDCRTTLTERGLSALSRLPKLIHLDLSYLEAASNVVLKSLALHSHQLKELICRGCPDITDDSSSQVVSMCNDLELLDLSGCNNISMDTVIAASTSVKIRTNNVPLKLIIGGTSVESAQCEGTDLESVLFENEGPLLTVDLADYSEEHLRPDFIDDMFFPGSDSDSDDDLDHPCCDCDFNYDDLNDPTLFPSDFEDDTPKFGDYDDTDDSSNWMDTYYGNGEQEEADWERDLPFHTS